MQEEHLPWERFGRIVIVEKDGIDKNRNQLWRCICDCGNILYTSIYLLKTGHIKSCGCYQKEARIKHGNASGGLVTKEYKTWLCIKERCFNEKVKEYKRYGGAGITMSPFWVNNFPEFLKYIGKAPSKYHTIDRYPNNQGNYEPGNVRWATKIEQGRNRKTNKYVEFNGESKCLAQWADEIGISRTSLSRRLFKLKWPIARALSGSKTTVTTVP